ncbi:hypothetical protein HET69_41330 [Streptomyces sp. CJ_13]|uniref:hypothetical protein n=1 Tax=Streptomyces sp. CJ_13 TaxID=2724943 RepID=UPI001BDBD376|nr:hypothetical protein [Streptomyces sp. CJ_13]MBT1190245.1 hypothetical protein [Streptomyces sp. CJ_13]
MPFEDELGNALRRAGDDFTTDGHALVEAGERRGRRLVARRRAAVFGVSVLALGAIATGGAYTGGLFAGAGGSGGGGHSQVNVAAPPELPARADARAVLESLVPKNGITVASKGGEDDYAYLVLDDGKGASLVQVNVQESMGEALGGRMGGAATLPDGTKVLETRQPGEKGGAGVLWWTVDTLRPDGRRVVVSAFNTGNQAKPATRKEPALTMEQLRTIALDPKWFG